MRIDKYLKVSRIIKRRTVANEACDAGRVEVNGKIVRASYDVKIGDEIVISMGQSQRKYKVLQVADHALKDDVVNMYEILWIFFELSSYYFLGAFLWNKKQYNIL